MRVIYSYSLLLLILLSLNCGSSSTSSSQVPCDPSTITTANYLMSFHACAADDECTDPSNHTVYLAKSDDGVSWSLVEEFDPVSGSVPDIIFHDGYLYLMHTQDSEWMKLNSCFGVVSSGEPSLESDTDENGWVDPSMIEDENGDLVLFYLPGTAAGTDPASCSSSPCTKEIHSATISENFSQLVQIDGSRLTRNLTAGGLSDPDIIKYDDDTYLLYVSSGQNTYVYQASGLEELFQVPSAQTNSGDGHLIVSVEAGGVPGAIKVGDEVWLYVTTSSNEQESIRRAVSSDGITVFDDEDFVTVIDDSSLSGFSAGTSFSSPSIIAWPTETWNDS